MFQKELKKCNDDKFEVPKEKIAVLLATYNGERYLREQLESLRCQTYKDFICFIHDDGSQDNTEVIIKEYVKATPENFVYLGSNPTGGAKYNFMYLLGIIEAEYIMFCDQDDVWMPEKIEKTFAAMKKAESSACEVKDRVPICVYSDLKIVDQNLKTLSDSFYNFSSLDPYKVGLADLLYQNVAVGCTVMINKALQRLTVACNVTDKIIMHDWYIMLLARSCGETYFVEEPLIYYRQHGNNTIGIHKKDGSGIKNAKIHGIKNYLSEKKDFLDKRKLNAQALLAELEYISNEWKVQNQKNLTSGYNYHESLAINNIEVVRVFIKRQSRPLWLRILMYFLWEKRG